MDTNLEVRCPRCSKLVAERLEGMMSFTCPRCHQRTSVEHPWMVWGDSTTGQLAIRDTRRINFTTTV